MDRQTQRKIINKLTLEGYKVKPETLTDGSYIVVIDSNYDGAYPTKETFNILNDIRRKYEKHHRIEPRGHYTAIFIY